MQKQILAKKYRPKRFGDVLCQDVAVAILRNDIISNTLSNAYILTGTRGVGKTTLARIFAKSVNCISNQNKYYQENTSNNSNGEPCLVCENCIQADHLNFVDIIEIDAASNTGVDNVRAIIENAVYMPHVGSYKIYIIDEVHMLSKSAFNAMLKILEDTPKHVIFVLATTEINKVPSTILSRCISLKLTDIDIKVIANNLAAISKNECITYEDGVLDVIAKAADGSMRDAISILDGAISSSRDKGGMISNKCITQLLRICDYKLIDKLLKAIFNHEVDEILNIVNVIKLDGYDYEYILSNLQHNLFDLTVKAIKSSANGLNNSNLLNLQICSDICELTMQTLKLSSNKHLTFATNILKMLVLISESCAVKPILDLGNTKANASIISIDVKKVEAQEVEVQETEVQETEAQETEAQETEAQEVEAKINAPIIDNNIADRVQENKVKALIIDSTNWIDISKKIYGKSSVALRPILSNLEIKSHIVDENEIHRIDFFVHQIYVDNMASFSDKSLEFELSVLLKEVVFEDYTDKTKVDHADNVLITFHAKNQIDSNLKSHLELEKQKLQSEALSFITNDPYIHDLQNLFDVKVESIKPR